MSFRGARSEKSKDNSSILWWFRALFVVLGLGMGLIGWTAMKYGYWWVRAYNPNVGTVGTGPVLTIVFVAAMFVLIGLIPWPSARQNAKSKDDIYKMPKPLK
jgi:hypothetical protein